MAMDHETRLSFYTAAKWTNRFVITGLPYGVRISFSESVPGDATEMHGFHSAVIMSVENAKALADLLRDMAGKAEVEANS